MTFRTMGVVIALMVGSTALPCVFKQTEKTTESIKESLQDQWTPPKTSLPKSFVEAVRIAFQHGLADPRGGEFRVISIPSREPSRRVRVTGWVMPARNNLKAYAIGWDGLIYRDFEAGPPSDLNAFVLLNLQRNRAHSYLHTSISGELEPGNLRTLLGVALLLRLNHAYLAEELAPDSVFSLDRLNDLLKIEIVVTRYRRALYGFEIGDFVGVIDDTDYLLQNKATVDDVLSMRVELPVISRTMLQALRDDALRRLESKSTSTFDPDKNRTAPMDRRITEIIENLDHVDAEGYEASYIDWSHHPVYKAALEVGDAMIPALLRTMQDDRRLTQTIKCVDQKRLSQRCYPVRELAAILAAHIVGIRILPKNKEGNYDVKRFLSFMKETNNLSPVERLYRILAQDELDPTQWLDATQGLILPVNCGIGSRTYYPISQDPDRFHKPFFADSLSRDEKSSLTSLLSKRALQTMPTGQWTTQDELSRSEQAVNIALCMAKWDLTRSRETFKELYLRLVTAYAALDCYTMFMQYSLIPSLSTVTRLRVQAKDDQATIEYEPVVMGLERQVGSNALVVLLPLVEKPDWGDRIARKLFIGKSAKWNIAHVTLNEGTDLLRDVVDSRLVSLGSVRQSIITALQDRTIVGTVFRDRSGSLRYKLNNGEKGGDHPWQSLPDPRDPKTTSELPYRLCDRVASMIQGYIGAPEFRGFWSLKDRDEANKKIIKFIKKHGSKLIDLRLNPISTD